MSVPVLKVGIIGSSGVGKTCLARRHSKDYFEYNTSQTIGVDFDSSEFDIKVNRRSTHVKLQIWDTAGHERFHALAKSYYRMVSGMILCYDVSDPESIEECRSLWFPAVLENTTKPIVIVVGCKIDKLKTPFHIRPEIQSLIDENPDIIKEHLFCSSRKNINIEEVFKTIAKLIYEKVVKTDLKNDWEMAPTSENTVKLTKDAEYVRRECC